MTVGVKQQALLRIDRATDELISQAAHFLGMTKKHFVAGAAMACPEQRREEVRRGMVESMRLLDGSLTSTVAMLAGLSHERIEELGGTGEVFRRDVTYGRGSVRATRVSGSGNAFLRHL